MLPNLTIKARLAIAMLVLSVLLLVVGALGLLGMSRSNAANHATYANQMPSAMAIAEADIWLGRVRTALFSAGMDPESPHAAELLTRTEKFLAQSESAWQRYLSLPRDAEEERLAQDVIAKRKALYVALDAFAAAVKSADRQKIIEAGVAQTPYYAALQASGETLSQFQSALAKRSYEAAEASCATFRTITIAALLAGLALAIYSWVALRRAIARPLDAALAHFGHITAGDLSRPVEILSQDEMGQLLSGIAKMQDGLAQTVLSVRTGSETIAAATRQIAAGNVDLSSRTEQQAASLEETAASMEELTTTVKQNADNARQAAVLSATASETANHGGEVIRDVVATMSEINESSTRIADIISIIEGIAFQTNILALNAAVEAARAGEQGRGFAVVAGEVRSLAQRSSSAAKEIKDLIDKSSARVTTGTALVDQAGSTMTEIIRDIQRVSDIMGEISAASVEQTAGIDQVAHAVSQMDEVTQQNASLVEEAAAAAQSLEEQAAKLNDTVAVFRLGNQGVASAASAPAPHAVRAASRPAAPSPRRSAPVAQVAPRAVAASAPASASDWSSF
ncbi:methyl-accepting chemotaxis protein [Cupriavidus basilensis]|uniref:methyl-accepting chemotaxis protein n=1 Tax=Cupriavidus basilensis TaxID=68895 RepID=UPI00157B521C|nr:methyl-accepting chemotaxis protein [Cupriavidus basilensis]NUA30634.1 HAMP domain-containing protein [Cupriavidus basilensis]